MANITALLKINEQGNGELESVKFYVKENGNWVLQNSNNISALPYSSEFKSAIENETESNKTYGGAIGTPIGLCTVATTRFGVDEGESRTENYKGLIFGYTDSNSKYNCKIELVGTDILDFSIYFDESLNLYPTEFTYTDINGNSTTVTNSSRIISLTNLVAGYGTTTIEFEDWSAANKSIQFTYFENIPLDIELSKQWIDNFESQNQSASSNYDLQYGVLSNTGNIDFIDYNKFLYNKSLLGHLNAYIFDLSLYINGNLIQTHISTDSPLYSQNNVVELKLTNKLELWNQILVDEHNFTSSDTLYDILSYVLSFDESFAEDVSLIDTMTNRYDIVVGNGDNAPYLNVSVEDYLRGINITNGFKLESGSIMEEISKICVVAQLTCFQDDDGMIVMDSARPIFYYYDEGGIIEIPYSKQISPLTYDILVTNRFEEIEFK